MPRDLSEALRAAATAAELVQEMERLSVEVQELGGTDPGPETIADQTVADFLALIASAQQDRTD
ncbi:hypothetical protein [Nocardioides ochotonae]|uniref:hypothetical protein n=1 Tax=Nocardioides ochotonae TaxID=2685869 RepID=UPI00140BE926|nr:hypothetical protein [Nocardioides ochotonae]